VSIKRDIRAFLREHESPLLHKLSPSAIHTVLSGAGMMSKVEHDIIMDTYLRERGLAPVMQRSPITKWAAWRLRDEMRRGALASMKQPETEAT